MWGILWIITERSDLLWHKHHRINDDEIIYRNTPSLVTWHLARLMTHWGRVTHICVSNITIISSDNGLSPGRRQALIWTNAEILLIGPLETNFSEILIGIQTFSFKKMYLNISSAKWRPFCLGLNVFSWIGVGYSLNHYRKRWLIVNPTSQNKRRWNYLSKYAQFINLTFGWCINYFKLH